MFLSMINIKIVLVLFIYIYIYINWKLKHFYQIYICVCVCVCYKNTSVSNFTNQKLYPFDVLSFASHRPSFDIFNNWWSFVILRYIVSQKMFIHSVIIVNWGVYIFYSIIVRGNVDLKRFRAIENTVCNSVNIFFVWSISRIVGITQIDQFISFHVEAAW